MAGRRSALPTVARPVPGGAVLQAPVPQAPMPQALAAVTRLLALAVTRRLALAATRRLPAVGRAGLMAASHFIRP